MYTGMQIFEKTGKIDNEKIKISQAAAAVYSTDFNASIISIFFKCPCI